MSIAPNTVDKICLETEKYLNVAGYIPVVSCLSSIVRSALGAAQVICGLAVAIFAALAYLYNRCRGNDAEMAKYSQLFMDGANYIGQGCLNQFRAFIEHLPLINLLCIPYDILNRRYVLRYPSEPVGYQRHINLIQNCGASARASLGTA